MVIPVKIDDLEAFLTVVQTGSVTRAAEQMSVTQPALTYRIQSLEKTLGYQLFERDHRQKQFNLSAEGREFYVIAEKMEMLWKDGKAISKPRSGKAISKPRPVYRVAATYALNYYVMPSVCSAFWSRNLPISMEIHAMHCNECYAGIEENSLDAAVLTRTISSRLPAIPVWEDKMVLVCSSSAEYNGEIHPSELDPEKCIYIFWNPEYAKWHEYWFRSARYQIRSDNIRLAEKLLSSNPGYWSIAPLPIVKTIEKYRELKHIPLGGDPPAWPVYLLSKKPNSTYNQYMIEDIRSFMKKYS